MVQHKNKIDKQANWKNYADKVSYFSPLVGRTLVSGIVGLPENGAVLWCEGLFILSEDFPLRSKTGFSPRLLSTWSSWEVAITFNSGEGLATLKSSSDLSCLTLDDQTCT